MNNNIFKVLVCALLCGTSVQAGFGPIDPNEPIDPAEFSCCHEKYYLKFYRGKAAESKKEYDAALPITEAQSKALIINNPEKYRTWNTYINSLANDERKKDFFIKYLQGNWFTRSLGCFVPSAHGYRREI